MEGGNGVVGDQLSVTSKHATAWIQEGDNNDITTKATTEILPTRSSKLKDYLVKDMTLNTKLNKKAYWHCLLPAEKRKSLYICTFWY